MLTIYIEPCCGGFVATFRDSERGYRFRGLSENDAASKAIAYSGYRRRDVKIVYVR